MENNIIVEEQKVTVKGSDLLKKFKTKEDRFNFLREMSNYIYNFVDLYMPDLPGFDSDFFLMVLTGQKKLLPLGHHTDFNLKYFRKDSLLTKEFLIKIINDEPNYKLYLPDNIELKSLSRDYILSVSVLFYFQLIAYLTPNVYNKLYELYKERTKQNEAKKWNNYAIKVMPEIKEKITNFVPCQNYLINKKPFRLSKNGQVTNIFKNIENENNVIEDNMIGSGSKINNDKNIKIQFKRKNNIEDYNDIQNEMNEDEK